ncbi:hypothetical protein [Candidatus Aalborgicola defluviihabitans]|uniref:hypothetical protein n=1 Tax=Candidatus Aalborgicola defluviihabitans TaxID=3386187 RepID=UPI001EC22986|nr:hypothetical protein [Burkholderiales bacterium]
MNTPQPASAGHSNWRRQLTGFLMLFWLLALVAIAQPTINSIVLESQLPLRNIQIEVRQVQSGTQETHNRQSQRNSTSSTVLVPLGEWVRVAESDIDSRTNRAGWGGPGVEGTQQASELQVRLSVR